jgi:hypothetical protein
MKQTPHTNSANLKQYADRLKAEHPFVYSSTSSMEHCIVYFSSSISLFQEADLVSLLQQSRSHNATAGITGILLIDQGSIVQVLEGKQEIIETLYKRIEQDRRHTDVIKVVDIPIEERSFVGWDMGCKTITSHQLELIKTIVDLGKVDWLLTKPSTNSIVNMLKSAYQSDFHYSLRVAKPEVPNLLHNHIQEWKQHYRQLAQAVEAIENESKKRSIELKESELVSLEVSQEQRIEEIMRLFESNRMLIWERQQGELSQNFILA